MSERDMLGNVITPEMAERHRQVYAMLAAGETLSAALELVYGIGHGASCATEQRADVHEH